MEVTILALALAVLVFLFWASRTLNNFSEMEYGYTPVSYLNISLATIPYVLLIAGFFIFEKDPSNQMMSVILGVASIIGLFWWIEHHSSAWVALGSISILLIAGVAMVAITLLLLSGGNRDDDYYD